MLKPIQRAGMHEIRVRQPSDMFCIMFSWICKAYKEVLVEVGKSKWTDREAFKFMVGRQVGPASMKQ